MTIFGKDVKIKTTIIILVLLFVSVVVVGIWFGKTDDPKALSILGSLFSGLIVAIIQLIIAWQDYYQIEKFKKLELIKIMYDRDDRIFYEEYIGKAKQYIYVMGVTAIRFFNDFADYEQSATSNAKVLLHKLAQGVQVRILLPEIGFLAGNKKNDFEEVKQHVGNIKTKFTTYRLAVRYFNHIPAHSVFIIDDTCIVGPVFPNIESKYTPALHLRNTSPIAIKYQDYFNMEWESAHE
jgi:hypothetical protein